MEKIEKKKRFKEKILKEFTEYFFNFLFMAVIFSAIIFYRRLVLAHHGIILDDYFVGVFKAFVIAKVVMLGGFLSISRKFENKPLIIPVFYKAFIFTILVMLFDIIEVYIKGLFMNFDLVVAFLELKDELTIVWLGGAMLIFFIFIPFFAFRELARIMGKDKVRNLFLKSPTNN